MIKKVMPNVRMAALCDDLKANYATILRLIYMTYMKCRAGAARIPSQE